MRKFLQNICTGVIYLYILTIALFFAPYYNWNYAKTHGFVKWICFGEVVASAKAVVWPYYVFLSTPVVRYESPDESHFRNSKTAYEEAIIVVNNVGGISNLTTDLKVNFAELLRLSIDEANQIQPSYLQETHPDYLRMYEEKYKHGISLMLQGSETDNMPLILRGAFECNEFADWVHEHKSDFSFQP